MRRFGRWATTKPRRTRRAARSCGIATAIRPVCFSLNLTRPFCMHHSRKGQNYQKNSSRHFMREVNRLGVTGVIDAGGGFQNYPEDYRIIEELHSAGELTVRIAYNLFTQKPKEELADFRNWTRSVRPGQGDDFYRHNGAGEMLVYSAPDSEGFGVC